MWRVEYIGEDPELFGHEGWALPGDSHDTMKVKFDGETEWAEYERGEFEGIEYGR